MSLATHAGTSRRALTGVVAATALMAGTLTGLLAAPAQAAITTTGNYTLTVPLGTVYSSNSDYNTMYAGATLSQAPSGSVITGGTVTISPYNNGGTNLSSKICYRKEYTNYDYKCITGPASGTISLDAFNGLGAHASWNITHYLVGGTYPTTGGGKVDTINVTWTR